MAKSKHPAMNSSVPHGGNLLTRVIGSLILKSMGWRVSGTFPQEKKLVFIGCPHTSNWDFILALASMQSVGLKCNWMMKKEAFFWPFGGLFRRLGGIPIDRTAAKDTPTQMADWFARQDKAYLGMTPEGTRSKVKRLKTGYWRIARKANIPVFLIGVDAVNKIVKLDRLWPLTGDMEADNAAIKAYYDSHYKGIRPELG